MTADERSAYHRNLVIHNADLCERRRVVSETLLGFTDAVFVPHNPMSKDEKMEQYRRMNDHYSRGGCSITYVYDRNGRIISGRSW